MVAAVLAIVAIAFTWWLTRPDKWRPDQDTAWPPIIVRPSDLPPDVPWERQQDDAEWGDYRPGFKKDIDRAGDARDCAALRSLLTEGLNQETDDRLALTYIFRWAEHDQCQEILQDAA